MEKLNKWYVGMRGNNFIITELKAATPKEARDEVRKKVDGDGWVILGWANSPPTEMMYAKFEDIVAFKPHAIKVRPRNTGEAR